jgi:transposase InsO family protein
LLIRSDNGREFISAGLLEWLRSEGVEPIHIAKASPQQNGYVERFNGSMRDELLNRESIRTLTEARVLIGNWVDHYNTGRPHSGLKMRTPAAFAAYCERHLATTQTATAGPSSERGR